MNLTRIEGPPTVCHCDGCNRDGIGGTVPYLSASTEEVREPEDFYQSEDGALYCGACSAKLMETDPTRSVNKFYLDTEGTQIDPEHL
jgi:hypothetical protein